MNKAISVGIRSLAVSAPPTVRTNQELRDKYPELLERPSQSTLGRILNNTDSRPDMALFDAALEPYLNDPFRGTIHRRVLGPEEDAVGLEVQAGREALALAQLQPEQIGLLISVSFIPDHVGIGNAVYVARELGLKGAAWNLESACGGPLAALQTAFAQVRSGEHEHVLITVSCAYSRYAREDDTMSWFLGDGGGAFVVSRVADGTGYVSSYSRHTADTCGTWHFRLEKDEQGQPARIMRAHQRTGRVMRKTAERHLKECCKGAAAKAGMSLDDVDFFVFHTPAAWFAEFGALALGIDSERTTSIHRHYANVGPALTPINLHYAAFTDKVKPGQHVLVYGPGSVSSASALLMRWGEVALGQPPAGIEY